MTRPEVPARQTSPLTTGLVRVLTAVGTALAGEEIKKHTSTSHSSTYAAGGMAVARESGLFDWIETAIDPFVRRGSDELRSRLLIAVRCPGCKRQAAVPRWPGLEYSCGGCSRRLRVPARPRARPS